MTLRQKPPRKKANRVLEELPIRGRTPKSLITFLDTYPEGFPLLAAHNLRMTQRQKEHMASHIWTNLCRPDLYEHKIDGPGYFTYHCKKLDEIYGKGRFKRLNDVLGFYEVGDWCSMDHHITKSYRLTEKLIQMAWEFVTQPPPPGDYCMTRTGGRPVYRFNAIASLDSNGNAAKHKHSNPLAVEIDTHALREAIDAYQGIKNEYLGDMCHLKQKARYSGI